MNTGARPRGSVLRMKSFPEATVRTEGRKGDRRGFLRRAVSPVLQAPGTPGRFPEGQVPGVSIKQALTTDAAGFAESAPRASLFLWFTLLFAPDFHPGFTHNPLCPLCLRGEYPLSRGTHDAD